jgi:hypothetical protein
MELPTIEDLMREELMYREHQIEDDTVTDIIQKDIMLEGVTLEHVTLEDTILQDTSLGDTSLKDSDLHRNPEANTHDINDSDTIDTMDTMDTMDTIDISKLNHPWSIYFQEPTSSYTKYDVYYGQTISLLQHLKKTDERIKKMSEDQVQLTNIIIGTPMEDALQKKKCSSAYIHQWQQLFPFHITKFMNYYMKLNKKISIDIIIVSPDEVFMDSTYMEPLFMTHCWDCNFKKVKNREYVHVESGVEIRINIFTCPFPQLEKNDYQILKTNLLIKEIEKFPLQTLAPSEQDAKFINKFYSCIESIASNPSSNLIINSYATFRNVREYDNYGLFKTLLEIANKYKIIATEWHFSETNYFTHIVSKINSTIDHMKYSVCYIDPFYSRHLIEKYEKISFDEIRKIMIDVAQGRIFLCMLIKFPYGEIVVRKIRYNN